jgi:hypothetical protein
MCKFISGITLENGDVKISKKTDSHHEILTEFGISDKELPPNFCAWEFTPPIKEGKYDYAASLDEWFFSIDDAFPTPEWWDEGRKKLTIDECKKELESVILKTGTHEIIDIRIILLGDASAVLWENASAELWENASAVLWGNARAVLRENASAVLRENASAVLRENASAELWGNARAELRGNARAELRENASAVLRENARAENTKVFDSSILIDRSNDVTIIITAKNRFEDK